ncbi:MAG: hypothetical protein AB7F64_05255 [Gammaproteobacteria bacterium]
MLTQSPKKQLRDAIDACDIARITDIINQNPDLDLNHITLSHLQTLLF